MQHLSILGTRGLPAKHGGFETFAEKLALWLRDRDCAVTVYCQGSVTGKRFEDEWQGIRRVHIPVTWPGELATIQFDIGAVRDVRRRTGPILTLGYNTGPLGFFSRFENRTHFVNMDGHEWSRQKYGPLKRRYLQMAEAMAARYADHLIADHPDIASYLTQTVSPDKVSTIAYGADLVDHADPTLLELFGLEPGRFFTLIARPEPENSVLEIVRAFSRKKRDVKLVVLGDYDPNVPRHAEVLAANGGEVLFPGAVYDKDALRALRFFSLAYFHGHQVGGTNPSLVEALGAGNAVIAHKNKFNEAVAQDAALYFTDEDSCAAHIERLIEGDALRSQLSAAARKRWEQEYQWDGILTAYHTLLATIPAPERRRWWARRARQSIDAPSLTPSSA